MCVSVCPSVRGHISGATRVIFTNFMHVAYGRGSVLLQQGDEIPRGRGSFGGFLPHWQCIVQHSIWDPYKNGLTDRHAVWHDEWAWPDKVCCVGVTIPDGEGIILGKHVPDKPNTANNCNFGYEGPILLKFTYLPVKSEGIQFIIIRGHNLD